MLTSVFKAQTKGVHPMSKLLAALLLLVLGPGCALLPGETPPGNGRFYSDHGGYENKCPTKPCDVDCGIGHYRADCSGNSSGSCKPCNSTKPENSEYSTGGGLTGNCEWLCKQGYTQIDSKCVNNTECKNIIPVNSVYSNNNTPTCDYQCKAGYFNNATAANPASCSTCLAGTYSAQGATVCSKCPAGTYSTVDSSPSVMNCQKCDAGKFSTTLQANSQTFCTSCSAGTFSSATAATAASACTECAAGTASTSIGANSVATCAECGMGKFSNTTGRSVCTDCAAGTFSNVTGATKCFNCNPNTYAATTGLSVCAQCEYCATAGRYRNGCGGFSAGFCDLCSNPAV